MSGNTALEFHCTQWASSLTPGLPTSREFLQLTYSWIWKQSRRRLGPTLFWLSPMHDQYWYLNYCTCQQQQTSRGVLKTEWSILLRAACAHRNSVTQAHSIQHWFFLRRQYQIGLSHTWASLSLSLSLSLSPSLLQHVEILKFYSF